MGVWKSILIGNGSMRILFYEKWEYTNIFFIGNGVGKSRKLETEAQ